jgi:DNA-binding MarR family transcriptional regulator
MTLEDQLCFALYSATIAINRAYKPILDKLEITYPQYLVLSTLWEEDGRKIGNIASRLTLDPSTITPLMKRLEKAGFVTRKRNDVDERQVHVFLTEAGRALQDRSKCLGETLAEASGMKFEQLDHITSQLHDFCSSVDTYTQTK